MSTESIAAGAENASLYCCGDTSTRRPARIRGAAVLFYYLFYTFYCDLHCNSCCIAVM